MKSYYRISDKSYIKTKLPGATKLFCLDNFLEQNTDIKIFADNCNQDTIDEVLKRTQNVVFSQVNNAANFFNALNYAIEEDSNEIIYFVEDDYLHRPNIESVIAEGLEKADYITLYDHPDKYQKEYNFGENCKVIKTRQTHWRTTISTCMTFAAKVKTLREDFDIFEQFTKDSHPHDHQLFSALKKKDRVLLVCIPGMAMHMDMTYPLQTPNPAEVLEEWALDILLKHVEVKTDIDLTSFNKYQKLMIYETLKKMAH